MANLLLILFVSAINFERLVNCVSNGTVVTHTAGYVASIRLHSREKEIIGSGYLCAGILINSNHVLTVASCVASRQLLPSEFVVVLGTNNLRNNATDGTTHKVSRINVHPGYHNQHTTNNVAVLKLSEHVDGITPLKLDPNSPEEYEMCKIMGWGAKSVYDKFPVRYSEVLLQAQIVIQNSTICGKIFINQTVKEGDMCAGDYFEDNSSAPCIGDSGGPLLCRESYVSGIIISDISCGQRNSMGLFSTTSYYHDWILQASSSAKDKANIFILAIPLILLFPNYK